MKNSIKLFNTDCLNTMKELKDKLNSNKEYLNLMSEFEKNKELYIENNTLDNEIMSLRKKLFYIDELKPLTGNDVAVRDYVMKWQEAQIFRDKLTDMCEFLIPNYIKEGKTSLVIGIGCTGGKHRSVTITNKLAERLKQLPYSVKVEHRDIMR